MADDFNYEDFDFDSAFDELDSMEQGNDDSFGDFGDTETIDFNSDSIEDNTTGETGESTSESLANVDTSGLFGNNIPDRSEVTKRMNSKDTKKIAIIASIAGIAIVVVGCLIASHLVGGKADKKDSDKSEQTQTQVVETQPTQNQIVQVQPVVNNGWTEFKSANSLVFDNARIKTKFIVTGCNTYVNTSNSSAFEVKTIINGNIQGFNGRYSIEVRGIHNNYAPGQELNVEVQTGNSNGNLIIGDIVFVG